MRVLQIALLSAIGTGAVTQATAQATQVNITDPNFTTLADMAVNLTVDYPNMENLRIELIAPNGTDFVLLREKAVINAAGTGTTNVNGRGITGHARGQDSDGNSSG